MRDSFAKCVMLALLAFDCAGFSTHVLAAGAHTRGTVHMRAGPSREYPLAVSLPPDSFIHVDGCLEDWSWCDVDWEGNRGWVYSQFLHYDYQDQTEPIIDYGPRLGLTIVTFDLGTYWGRYYRGRPWYARRNYWAHRSLPPRRPPHARAPMSRPAPARPDSHRPVPAQRPARPSVRPVMQPSRAPMRPANPPMRSSGSHARSNSPSARSGAEANRPMEQHARPHASTGRNRPDRTKKPPPER